jgi:hypothetical protein
MRLQNQAFLFEKASSLAKGYDPLYSSRADRNPWLAKMLKRRRGYIKDKLKPPTCRKSLTNFIT